MYCFQTVLYHTTLHCVYIYVAYVLSQDDTVTGTLSVRENIMFSASLRLPKNTTYEEKSANVDEVIHDLGLTHVADTWVSEIHIYTILYITIQLYD